MSDRDVITDEVWALIGPCFPAPKATGRPPMDRRLVAEAVAWKFRTGSPWRDVPERFGNWNTIYRHFDRWAKTGVCACALERAQQAADAQGELDWVCSIDSTIVRAHQHAATLPRHTGGPSNYKNLGPEPGDHAIGRSRGGLTCKIHAVSDGKGRLLAFVLTGGQAADTSLLPEVLDQIRVPRPGPGRPRTRPDRVLADKGYPSRANRAWLAERGIKATIPDRQDQAAHRRRRGSAGGRPPAFDPEVYRGRNVIERCFAKLKQWRGIAMRTCKTARSYAAAISLAATLHWLTSKV
ncbi:IS5 family transposase [Brachybacterium sillae]|uniref:IS5 family transposase n=1 Tax=Brachybacterium sillae TaxID=2810536 RepID=UPI00217DE38F|nr:IS5 family transposase [Brachybacterium sillae]